MKYSGTFGKHEPPQGAGDEGGRMKSGLPLASSFIPHPSSLKIAGGNCAREKQKRSY
jgi:hypothetical protein